MTGLTTLTMRYSYINFPYVSPLYDTAFTSPAPGVACYEPKEISVVLGYGGSFDKEVYINRCRKDGVNIYRRLGGGGAVVLNKGIIVLEAVLEENKRRDFTYYYRMFFDIVSNCLHQIGLKNMEFKGISDFCVRDRKIAGTCMRRSRGFVLFQMSFMMSSQIRWIERYLKLPPRMPDYRQGRQHRDFVTDLQNEGIQTSNNIIIEIFRNKLLDVVYSDRTVVSAVSSF